MIIHPGSTLTIKCKVNFPEKAKIVVQPGGKLILDGATVTNHQRCNNMWEGIRVSGNPLIANTDSTEHGTLILKKATVSFARIGVANYMTDSLGNPVNGTYGGIIKVQNQFSTDTTFFLNNSKGLSVKKFPNNAAGQMYFKQCRFAVSKEVRDSLPSKYFGPTAYLDWIGAMAEVENTNNVFLQNNTFANTFYPLNNIPDNQDAVLKTLRVGIRLVNAEIDISGSSFLGLWRGIHLVDALKDVSITESYFRLNHIGIDIRKLINPPGLTLKELNIHLNDFVKVNDYGIHAFQNENIHLSIKENLFISAYNERKVNVTTTRPYAVKFGECPSSKLEVIGNNIQFSSLDGFNFRPFQFGIWALVTAAPKLRQFVVKDNNIYTFKTGIFVSGSSIADSVSGRNRIVFNNTIWCDSLTEAGISLIQTHDLNVIKNKIEKYVPFGDPVVFNTVMNKGAIRIFNTNHANIRCNTILTGPVGIQIEGQCMNTALRNNVIDFRNVDTAQTRIGIQYFENGITGPQGETNLPNDNLWAGCKHDTRTVDSRGENSPFYVRDFITGDGLHAKPINNTPDTLGGTCVVNCGIPVRLTAVESPYTCAAADTGNFLLLPEHFIDGGNAALWLVHRKPIYEQIAQNQIPFPLFNVQAQYMARQSLLYRLYAEPSLRTTTGGSSILADFWADNQTTVCNQLIRVDTMVNARLFAPALTLNQSVVPTNQIEINQQKYNNIWLAVRHADTLTTAQYNDLVAIANQCYLTGGKSVMDARGLLQTALNKVNVRTITFADTCTVIEPRKENEESIGLAKESFRFYPNPTQGSVQLNYQVVNDSKLHIQITNLTGQTVFTSEIMPSKNLVGTTDLNLENLPAGLYIIRFLRIGQTLSTQKITLIH